MEWAWNIYLNKNKLKGLINVKKMIKVTGLDCAHCATEFENVVKNAEGIEDAKMNFILEKMIITANSEEAIKNAIELGKKKFPDVETE